MPRGGSSVERASSPHRFARADTEPPRRPTFPGRPGSICSGRHRCRHLINEGALVSEEAINAEPLTIVLVHGAFADAPSWNGVVARLQAEGMPVMAPANPLRGIAQDSAYVASIFEQIHGPVLAVGHSYRGAVIIERRLWRRERRRPGLRRGLRPGRRRDTRRGRERLQGQRPDSRDHPPSVPDALASGAETQREFAIDPAKFHAAFAADLRPEQAAGWPRRSGRSKSSRSPSPSGQPAWKNRPRGGCRDRRQGGRLDVSARWPPAPAPPAPKSRAPT